MKRREFIKLATASSLTLSQQLAHLACRHKTRRPNIIFIMSDDHASRAISCYDDTLIRTPNLDRLAQEGKRVDLFFCTNAICAPSRASILTGQYSSRHGVVDNSQEFKPSQATLPELLQQAGYQTSLIGKWHLKTAPIGFDYYLILPDQGDYYNPEFIDKSHRFQLPGYVTSILTSRAIDWLKSRDRQKPFFLCLHHKASHRNWMPDIEFLSLFRDQELPVPKTFFDDYQNRCPAASLQEMRIADHSYLTYDLKLFPLDDKQLNDHEQTGLAYWNSVFSRLTDDQKKIWEEAYREENEEFKRKKLEGPDLALWKYQRYIKDYLRTVASIDKSLGQLLDYLDQAGLSDSTIVIYTSDQGFFLGEHGWFDKRFMYEPSIKTPLIIRYPDGLEKGVEKDHLLLNIDLAPTIMDVAGIDIPPDIQGSSFKRLLQGMKVSSWRESIYYHYYEYPGVHSVRRHYGIRTKQHKLIHYYNDLDCWELFDLEKDPDEVVNQFSNPEYQSVKEVLQNRLEEMHREIG